LALPAISTGAFGYPVSEAAPIAVFSTIEELSTTKSVNRVRFVLFDVATLRAYTRVAERLNRSNAAPPFRIEKAQA
jgi:O-acetyl-ADP-ribose deacetylase (regulator of RNase III)